MEQDADGNFYGVESGVTGFGTASATNFGWVYKMTPDGEMTHIYEDLTGTALPGDGVVLGQDGNFYGITNLADQYGNPTPLLGGGIYQLTLSGQYSIVFDWATYAEHVNSDTRPGGKLTEAYGYWWASIPADGFGGDSGILRLDLNVGAALVIPCYAGNGYGTATAGVCANPGHLVPGPDDTLYAVCKGCNWLEFQLPSGEFVDIYPGGVFKVTSDGTVTLVHGFTPDGNGVWPYEDLVRASDGNFYGSTMATYLPDFSVTSEAHIYRVSLDGDASNAVDNVALAPGVAMMQGSDGKLRGVSQSSAFALWNPGLLSSYLASPVVAQNFDPATIPQGEVATLTITLGNTSSTAAAILLAPLIDRLPNAVTVAEVPNASTTCTHGSVVADPGSNTITLAANSQIPGGTCTVTVSVTGTAVGNHINTIPAWAVETDVGGNVEPALAALTVTPVTDAIFADGFDG